MPNDLSDILLLRRRRRGGPSVPAPYTEAELAVLVAAAGGSWWRARDITSMYQGIDSADAQGGAPAVDGQPVGAILDKAHMGGLTAAEYILAADQKAVNGGFDTDSAWTKGVGWGIGSGVATHAGTTASNLTQSILDAGDYYIVEWDQAGGQFVSPYLGLGIVGQVLLANLSADGHYLRLGRAPSASFGFRSNADGAIVDNVSVKKTSGRPAFTNNIVNRPTLNAGMLEFGSGDILQTTIGTSLGTTCSQITFDGANTAVTEGQTIESGNYVLPQTDWSDHIILNSSLAAAGIDLARLQATMVAAALSAWLMISGAWADRGYWDDAATWTDVA